MTTAIDDISSEDFGLDFFGDGHGHGHGHA
jgi:hypothetical protein